LDLDWVSWWSLAFEFSSGDHEWVQELLWSAVDPGGGGDDGDDCRVAALGAEVVTKARSSLSLEVDHPRACRRGTTTPQRP
jgi:hypothetical protein